VVHRLQRLAQHWEQLLFTTGGALSLQKSFWYLMSWHCKKGQPKLVTTSQCPAATHLTAGNNQEPIVVPRIEPTSAFRT